MGLGRIDCSGDVKLTQQSAKDECDINLIVERAKSGADLSKLARGTPFYGDFTDLPDLRSAMLIVKQAEAAFMSLDAVVRKRFSNDPVQMMEFLNDPANREEAVKLGLVEPKKDVDVGDVEALAPQPTASKVDKEPEATSDKDPGIAEARKARKQGLS